VMLIVKSADLVQNALLPLDKGSGAAGAYSNQILAVKEAAFAKPSTTPSNRQIATKGAASSLEVGLEEKLFNSKAAFKITTNLVAMHLDKGWRDKLFSQVDALLNADDWQFDDEPIQPSSSLTFIRMLIFLRARRPGLGATSDGNIVASWTTGRDRLTIVCQPNDSVRWVLLISNDKQPETAAGQTVISRIPAVLQPYNPHRWFSNEG
jgi:hypothetical protein